MFDVVVRSRRVGSLGCGMLLSSIAVVDSKVRAWEGHGGLFGKSVSIP